MINFNKIFSLNLKKEKGIFKKMLYLSKNILSINYELYDLEIIDKPKKISDNTSNYLLKNLIFSINVFPVILNKFINKRLVKLPFVIFPNKLSIVTFTIFLNNINRKHEYSNIYFLINILCYSYLLLNSAYEFYIGDIYSPSNLCILGLNLLNLIIIYYLNLFFTYSVTESKQIFILHYSS
jgi:hypothetical protein